MAKPSKSIAQSYQSAKARYADMGVDTDAAMAALTKIPISLHCWQGDDVGGFENTGEGLSGGIAVTGNYPGKARTPDELRADLDQALALIPGKHRLNLHAFYGETGGKKVDRDQIEARALQGLDRLGEGQRHGHGFQPDLLLPPESGRWFHPLPPEKSDPQFLDRALHPLARNRRRHGQGPWLTPVTNVWIPDGYKDTPATASPRASASPTRSTRSSPSRSDPKHNLDAVECKLFGIGSESYVVGSHEFYMGYAIKNQKLLCLDAGHFHPTEGIADKISSVLMYVPEILLHVSRGVRWDSDHVVILDDALQSIATELVRNNLYKRTHIGLDFFDASINRIAAWTIGTRNTLRALLIALLEPAALRESEKSGDLTSRLALMEEVKGLPWGAVWDAYCESQNVPAGTGLFLFIQKSKFNNQQSSIVNPSPLSPPPT
jgi:L-rhamnose isomerase